MTSSENLIDSWAFRSSFPADSWLSEAYVRDTETLTKALQKSLSGATANDIFINSSNSNAVVSESDFISTTTVSNLSGSSDHETTLPTKRQRNSVPVSNSGKVSKRKSRASKRTQTTFITADPANFRQMVQQVTGVRFGNSQMPVTPILKPEPQRPGTRLPGLGGCLPTLDTSAFLLDHHQQHVVMGPGSGPGSGSSLGSGPFPFQGSLVGDGGLDFETFPNFPTLESWKVM
ncbi:hypothetical protein Dsin_012159 [Dipteronia sinensis]|uniref:VQ domain-containing protein n=1 Tax=Dipteronia sinensis TaxID=43782 RepID=A0AAE0AIS1_9ROSI|nr:hypothetical protein Dsin_012159 [Dipteronia sinensis]